VLGRSITAFFGSWKQKDRLLDVRGEQEKIRDLRHASTRDTRNPCCVGPVAEVARADHSVEAMGERKGASYSREAAAGLGWRLCIGPPEAR